MPTPNLDAETRREWINRCIPTVIRDGTTDRPDQAMAICVSMWDEALKKRKQQGNSKTSND